MIHFRHTHTNIGYIVMCPILIAFAGSTMILAFFFVLMIRNININICKNAQVKGGRLVLEREASVVMRRN
jgi:hypothetical protein